MGTSETKEKCYLKSNEEEIRHCNKYSSTGHSENKVIKRIRLFENEIRPGVPGFSLAGGLGDPPITTLCPFIKALSPQKNSREQ